MSYYSSNLIKSKVLNILGQVQVSFVNLIELIITIVVCYELQSGLRMMMDVGQA